MKKQLVAVGLGLVFLTAGAIVAWKYFSFSPLWEQHVDGPALTPTPGIPWFEDVTQKAGIDFLHFDPATPKDYIPETFGSGCGWIDYDNDGWLDLFCIQDGPLRPESFGKPLPTNKLFRNQGDGTFKDVTDRVGLKRTGYHMGCAVGDYDNDGFDDLLVTYLGGQVLYHNEPDGNGSRHFVDVTKNAGVADNPHFATSCAWGDVDGDGFLDLYVCNYVEVDLDNYSPCEVTREGKRIAIQCSPTAFSHTTHKLYRNNGNGTFTDVSKESGVATVKKAPGLAVVMCDLDGDGKLDIYVANDLQPAYLFHNQGGGKFKEKAQSQGCGLENDGSSIAGMGVALGDVDGSGRFSLFVTNYQGQANILFLGQGKLFFRDVSYPAGLAFPSLPRLGFGTVFFDADLDGWLDIAVANGHVQRYAKLYEGSEFAQTDQLFLNRGKGKFKDVSEKAGSYFHKKYVGRGLAMGDFDNDGRPDLAISNNSGPQILLRNATTNDNHGLVLELVGDGKKSNRNAIGARVEVEAAGRRQVHFVCGGGSYLSASSRRLHIGLGKATKAERITVSWPSGQRQQFHNLKADISWRLTEGQTAPEEIPLRRARSRK